VETRRIKVPQKKSREKREGSKKLKPANRFEIKDVLVSSFSSVESDS
jgi:hypothetical protein